MEKELATILTKLTEAVASLVSHHEECHPNAPVTQNSAITATPATTTTQTAPPPIPSAPKSKYTWDTPEAARHSLRVICDEEGLTPTQKNLMSQVVHCESGYHINAKHPNLFNGKVLSTDWGICQWNDVYHGKEITADDALHDPERAVRFMCKYVKAGKISQWVCFSSDLYLRYSA